VSSAHDSPPGRIPLEVSRTDGVYLRERLEESGLTAESIYEYTVKDRANNILIGSVLTEKP